MSLAVVRITLTDNTMTDMDRALLHIITHITLEYEVAIQLPSSNVFFVVNHLKSELQTAKKEYPTYLLMCMYEIGSGSPPKG